MLLSNHVQVVTFPIDFILTMKPKMKELAKEELDRAIEEREELNKIIAELEEQAK